MECCNICGLYYQKVFKLAHNKSVKHHEKLGQYYCNLCNLYIHISEKSSHLNSDEHKNKNKKLWCEESGKYITDRIRHFQSEIHNRHQQFGTPFSVETLVGVEKIVNQKLYIKLKVNPSENLEHNIIELLSKNYFPRYKYQIIYLAKFSKYVNGEEVFKRWIKSDLIHNHLQSGIQQDTHNTLIQKIDYLQLEGSGFQFQEIEEFILEIYKVNDIQASSYIELPGKYKDSKSIINIKNNDQFCFFMVYPSIFIYC